MAEHSDEPELTVERVGHVDPEDHPEGARAFPEKRPTTFTGR